MEATISTRGLRSNTTTCVTSNRNAISAVSIKPKTEPADRSLLLLRAAVASMILTLILLPGGFRALNQTGMGWEAWSFSRFLILPIIALHLICCWFPLAVRYFRPGECRDIPAFYLASAALLLQALIGYGLFAYHLLWYGGVA